MQGRVKAKLRILDLIVWRLQASHRMLLYNTPTSFLLVLFGISDCLNL